MSAGSGNTGFYALAGYWLDGTDGTDGTDGALMGRGVVRMDVRTRRNGSTTMGSGTGAPPLALKGRRDIGSGGWHQLRRNCKDA